MRLSPSRSDRRQYPAVRTGDPHMQVWSATRKCTAARPIIGSLTAEKPPTGMLWCKTCLHKVRAEPSLRTGHSDKSPDCLCLVCQILSRVARHVELGSELERLVQ